MIDINNYKNLKLKDVAEYERAKEGVVYPKGTTLIQLSATSGQVEYLKETGEVERKYAVVTPNKEINTKYFNIVVKRNIDRFISKYQAGMNIQIDDVKHIDIQLHNRDTQDMIASHIEMLESEEETTRKEIEILTTTKSRFLKDLLL